MPFSKIHVPESLSTEKCQQIAEELHKSLVSTCAVNPDDNFNLICRYANGDILVHPHFLGKRDPESTITVEITLLGGRTDEQKENFYSDFRKRLAQIDFEPNNSIVFLVENNPIDFSFSDKGSVKKVFAEKDE